MKWMLHDRKKNELSFRLEEHEIVDDMEHQMFFEGPPLKEGPRKSVSSEKRKVGSTWDLKFQIPAEVKLSEGKWDFIVIGDDQFKGRYIVASGYSYGLEFVCHQAMTKRI